jgi:hypothetical protein
VYNIDMIEAAASGKVKRGSHRSEGPVTGEPPSISVAELAAFILERDKEIAGRIAELDNKTPDRFAPAGEVTEHAGELGRQAGRRDELAALAGRFIPTAAELVPVQGLPPADERLAG